MSRSIACRRSPSLALAGCAALNDARQRGLELQPLAGRAQARAPTPSSGCRRSRRKPQAAAGARGRGARARSRRPASCPRPKARRPTSAVQVGARITATDRSPCDDPFWYGAYGCAGTGRTATAATAGALLAARTGGVRRYGAWLGLLRHCPYYEREVARADPRPQDRRAAVRGARQQRRHRRPARQRCCRRCSSAALKDFPNGGRSTRAGSRSTRPPRRGAVSRLAPRPLRTAPSPASARRSSSQPLSFFAAVLPLLGAWCGCAGRAASAQL